MRHDPHQTNAFSAPRPHPPRMRRPRPRPAIQGPVLPHVHLVSLSGGRDSAALGVWAAREHEAGRIEYLRYVYVHVGSRMEPETLAWLTEYEARVLTPRGLYLDVLQGDVDAWARQFERPWRRRPALPGPEFRTCTVELKIRPLNRWRRHAMGPAKITWLIGFRADEGSEKRRVQVSRFMDPTTGDEQWRPFVELGYGLADVERLLAEEGVPLPGVYAWTDRSGCVLCFYKPKHQLVEAARRYPASFAHYARQEEEVIAHTGTRGASPWVVTRGGTLRELVTAARAQTSLVGLYDDGPAEWRGEDCNDGLGLCRL